MCNASALYVTGGGTFSTTDTADAFVTPGDAFSLQFVVPSSPTITASNSTTVSFDVPVVDFNYTLNGTPVSLPEPTEVTFYTAADGGGFEVAFPDAEFVFGGSQIFSGTTAAPTFSAAAFSSQTFLFLDTDNADSNSATVTVTPTPEPSSILLLICGGIGLFAVGMRKPARVC
jgi:hypothetical protein